MFIETEGTPNPATLKFLPGRDVMGDGSADFAAPEAASRSPLASLLFNLPGVTRVFLGADFITVSKSDETEWPTLKPQVLGAIVEHFLSGRPAVEGAQAVADEDVLPEDAEIVAQIKELLDTRVRPAVAGDGGDIVFRGYRAPRPRAPLVARLVAPLVARLVAPLSGGGALKLPGRARGRRAPAAASGASSPRRAPRPRPCDPGG